MTRTDVTDVTGSPIAIEDLTRDELRALGALADAGMIAPLAQGPQVSHVDFQEALIAA